MFYINKRNLYIRVGVAVLIIAGIGLAFMGGIDFVNAQFVDSSELPEGYTVDDPFTDTSVQTHMSGAAMNEQYLIRYSELVQSNQQTIKDKEVVTNVSNVNTVGFHSKQSNDVDEEIYETEDMLYINESGSITTEEKTGDYSSPVLENQFKNASIGLNSFTVFKWSLVSIEDGTATYTLSRADPSRVPDLYTIDSAKGTVKVNTEKGYISEATVYITGTSRDNPTQLTHVSYSYAVTTETDVTKPTWVEQE